MFCFSFHVLLRLMCTLLHFLPPPFVPSRSVCRSECVTTRTIDWSHRRESEVHHNPPSTSQTFCLWTFNRVNIITSTTVNITNADHKDRISLDRTTGSLELWNLGLRDQGEYRVSIIPDRALELQGATTLDVYGGPQFYSWQSHHRILDSQRHFFQI